MVPYQESFENIISYTYRGPASGPHLLILGGVHGNEVCGQKALLTLKEKLDSGTMALERGTLTIVPHANPWACVANERYMECNLNRVIDHHKKPQSYEERLGGKIASLIDACDYLLDIHSISSYCPSAFVFNDFPKPENDVLAKAIGVGYVITDWHNMFSEDTEHRFQSTQFYVEKAGKFGCLVECGQHSDPQSIMVAERSIYNALTYLGFIAGLIKQAPQQVEVIAKKAFIKTKEGKMTKPDWHHFSAVKKGEIIAIYDDGEELSVPDDGVLILPFYRAQIGDEWFYFGQLAEINT